MKFQRNLRREEVGVNLTPLIDVVFLLLIFFMVTTTFAGDTSLRLTLPQAEGVPMDPPAERIEVLVGRDGRYAVNGRVVPDDDPDSLRRALAGAAREERDTPLIISADADAAHQAVVNALDAAARLGFTRVNIATRQPQLEQP